MSARSDDASGARLEPTTGLEIDSWLPGKISPQIAEQLLCVPLNHDGIALRVAVSGATSPRAMDDLARLTGHQIQEIRTSPAEVRRLLGLYQAIDPPPPPRYEPGMADGQWEWGYPDDPEGEGRGPADEICRCFCHENPAVDHCTPCCEE